MNKDRRMPEKVPMHKDQSMPVVPWDETRKHDPVEHVCPYASLKQVLDQALEQASQGKGKERHANEGEPFEKQIICEVRRRLGSGYTLGQAVKKIYESQRLEPEAGVRELLGAIVYIAAEVIVTREGSKIE